MLSELFAICRSAKAVLLAAISFLFAVTGSAQVILVQADMGRVIGLETGSPEEAAGFQLGEDLIAVFSFDLSTPDTNTNPDFAAVYVDPNATLTLQGVSSNATLHYFSGLRLRITNDSDFVLGNRANPANATFSPSLSNAAEFFSTAPVFSDPEDLNTVFADLFAAPVTNRGNTIAGTTYWTGTGAEPGMEIRILINSQNQFAQVPEPTGGALLLAGGTVFLALRRRR
ncbi:MAG: PEP-CTERM sorting domain-containing protein [Verrucomicrobiota bacterium]